MENAVLQAKAPLANPTGSGGSDLPREPLEDRPRHPASVAYSSLSSTAPDPEKFRKSMARSRITKISEMPAGSYELEIVPPPRAMMNGSDFECPYCCLVLPTSKFKDLKDWHEHVKHDAEPYVCLFDNCDSGDVLYANSKDWKDHMRARHLLRWSCNTRAHGGMYETATEFESHLRTEHPGQYTESQMRLITNNSVFFIEKIFDSCPLCGHTSGNIEEHVNQHLQQVAFKSLPLPDGPLEVTKDDGDRSKSISADSALASGSRSTVKNFMLSSPAEDVAGLDEQVDPEMFVSDSEILFSEEIPYHDWAPVFTKIQRGDALRDPLGAPTMEEQLSDPILKPFISNAYEL
ncbi:uncharacterized protein PV07_00670 [Cladophialophora immunda]|uniref:C2H2-type domain-containing protein n=1 Tax=Cladophialophora immunda TaxID=569365 RepID=A0A0D2DDS0_9EURO|nr:uncharacterized protein PV07_00670 [Cladophialophora immunda]KIW33854.1 hypothetical protein PV07_00670 [Cladophialophora immunda]